MEAFTNELRHLLQLLPTETYIRSRVASVLNFYFLLELEAIEVLQAGLMIDPLDPDLHEDIGRLYSNQEQFDLARQSLSRSLELAPDNPNVYGAFSYLEKDMNNLPASLDWMRQSSEIDPQDHELAAQIAEDLYDLQLPEEAERWYGRVQALAPGSAMARKAELDRALARGERDHALDLARAMISDQIDLRRGSFATALFEFVNLMSEDRRSKEAYDFLISVRPDIANYENLATDPHGLIMQWTNFVLLSGFETTEKRDAAWAQFAANMTAMGFPWLDDPDDQNHMWNYIMTGEPQKAADHYLERRLTMPLARNLQRHKKRLVPLFHEVYEDPRVAARMAELDKEFIQVREDVREMLQGEEWN
jgi:tetratricopeptide (TPR) repeat protein